MSKPRTLTGLIVPFNRPGRTSSGRLHFDASSLTFPADLSRVKLLIEHDQNRAIGYMTDVQATDAGHVATFALADTPDAIAAHALANARVRDGLSVGVELDDTVAGALARNPSVAGGTRGAGALREVSVVAIPAFDDSRITDLTGAIPSNLPAAAAAGTAPSTGAPMSSITTATRPALTTAAAPTGLTTATPPTGLTTATPPASAPAAPATASAPAAPATAAPATASAPAAPATAAPATASAPAASTPPAAPAQAAYAGNAAIVAEAPVYSFDGRGHSLVLDLIASRYDEDDDARARLAKFRRALADDGSAQEFALAQLAARTDHRGQLATAAVVKRDATTDNITPDGYRPDMLIKAIDAGRPLVSRVRNLPISGPNPFRMPTLGEFAGVADHTEGNSHVAEGTITVGGQTVTPTGVSGAYRLSRELAESTGPRIDTLVIPEMVKDYRRNSEARLIATLELVKAVADASSINTDPELRGQILAFYLARKESATVAAFGTTAYGTFANLTATDGRALYPWLGPSNANGTVAPGLTAMNINGVSGVPAWSVDATDIWLINGDDVLVFESAPRLFRFEEVEGPGIIKLAIWGYQAAHVTRAAGVRRLASV